MTQQMAQDATGQAVAQKAAQTVTLPDHVGPVTVYPCRVQVDTKHSVTFYPDNTQDGISLQLRAGTFELPPGFDLLTQLTPRGGRFLDLGGHIGVFTLAAAALGYRVLTVEGSPYNAALLRYAVAANGFTDSIQVLNAAVGNREGTVEFLQAGPYGFIANPYVPGPTVAVRLATVPALLAEAGWGPADHPVVDFIKLDIEGSEVAALEGMAAWLTRPDAPTILFESNGFTLHLFDTTPHHLQHRLAEYGYRCYQIAAKQLTPTRPGDLQPEVCVDFLAVKRALPALRGWRILPAPDTAALVQHVVRTAQDSHPHQRLHSALHLAEAPLSFLSQPEVMAVLDRLAQDQDESVRTAAAWWHGNQPQSRREQALTLRVAEQAAEIGQLRSALARAPFAWLAQRVRRG